MFIMYMSIDLMYMNVYFWLKKKRDKHVTIWKLWWLLSDRTCAGGLWELCTVRHADLQQNSNRWGSTTYLHVYIYICDI
jgi:hypothetical protein